MRRFPRELLTALLIACVHGLLYVFMVPAWQHYDEPTHAEYAWLIANKTPRPADADIDRDMRLMFARSMADTGFYRDKGSPPDLSAGAPTPNIGFTQLNDRPTYYWLAAVPMMALRDQPIETQLRGARLVSLLLLLLTVTSAWGATITLSPAGHPLRTLLPCSMALLPAFVDLMTAVNNDAGAIALFSLFLWGSLRLLKQRTWGDALWVALSALAAAAMKSTGLFAVPLAVMVFVLAFVPGRLRWAGVAALPALMLIGALVAVSNGDPAYWYRNASQDAPMRCAGPACAGQLGAGQHAFALAAKPGTPAPEMIQVISEDEMARLQGQTVTLGAWMWADRDGTTARLPELRVIFYSQPNNPITATRAVTVGTQPTWQALSMAVPAGVKYGALMLHPPQAGSTLYLDELVLVAGDQTFNTPANLAAMPNAIRNGSAEQDWPWLRPWAQARLTNLFADPLRYNFLLSPLDPSGASHYYELSARLLFETFWARFSWAQVAVPPAVFTLLALFTALSLVLTALTWPRWRRWLRPDHALLMGLALFVLWGMAFLRGLPWLDTVPFLTVARYAYPAIIPTVLVLGLGWSEVIALFAARRPAQRSVMAGLTGVMIALALLSVVTVALAFA